MNCGYDLIVTIVNKGYASDVMDAAKSKGATGGTILKGRGTGTKEIEKFYNITIQEEKEIVWIVAKHSEKDAIMSEIVLKTGLNSPGCGITFSMPVEDIIGINSAPGEAE